MSNVVLNFGEILAFARTLDNFPPVLEIHLSQAMQFSLSNLQSDAQDYAPYGEGDLHDSIRQGYVSAYYGTLISDRPYSWRQEEGFSGKTDSLGRYFPNYPGQHYMRKSLAKNKGMIRAAFESEIHAALNEVVGGGSTSGIMGWITI